MAREEEIARLWTKNAILDVENRILQQIMASCTPEGSEASVGFARFLRMSGLDSDNYPLFLKMLEIENHWVLDALIGDRDPFLLMSTIPPNEYLTSKCFQLLTRWRAGGIYPKTLAIVLGVLQNTYSSPRDGYKIYRLSVADVDNLGKHLEKEKGQNDPRNRCVLDILDSNRVPRRTPLGRVDGTGGAPGSQDPKQSLRQHQGPGRLHPPGAAGQRGLPARRGRTAAALCRLSRASQKVG